jgi:DNA replication protein DnaC
MEQARQQAEIAQLWRAANAPALHAARDVASLDTAGSAAWQTTLQSVIADVEAGGVLAILGGRGTGKTQMGVELMRHFTSRLRSCLYTEAQGLFLDLREGWRGSGESAAISRVCRPWLLVVDDLQDMETGGWEQRRLSLILDRRYRSLRPTVLLSNTKPDELRRLVGESIVDRMQERGGIYICDWKSFRHKVHG